MSTRSIWPLIFIRYFQQFLTKLCALHRIEAFSSMAFKETPQNVVQEFAGVQRLQIQRCLAAWFELQDSLREKAIGAVAEGAKTTGAMNGVRTKSLLDQSQQIGISNLPVVRTKSLSRALAFNADPAQSRLTQKSIVTRQRYQRADLWMRTQSL